MLRDNDPAVWPPVPALSAEERHTLLRLARQAVQEFLRTGRRLRHATDSPALQQPRATFVTLRRRRSGELRGCRGECLARQPLVESVPNMAIASATDDPRFLPVTLDELPDLVIEISALSPPARIAPGQVVVGRHGLLLIKGDHLGVLLPEVPESQGWDRQQFLAGLCRKAGLPEHTWESPDVELYAFETESWTEDEDDRS